MSSRGLEDALENKKYLLGDCYKSQEICNKAVENYSHALEYVPQCFMTENVCDKAVDLYPSTIKFVPECFMIQEMCDEAVNKCIFVFHSTPDQYKTQEMCDRVVSEDPFLIVYCSDTYKTQRMCNQANDDSLAALKLILDWFVKSKMIKELYAALYADENILYFNDDSGNVVFSCNEMGILNI